MRDVSERASGIRALDPERLIAVLAANHVRYVLIGALGARMQGFPRLTADADITPARDDENLKHHAVSAARVLPLPVNGPRRSRFAQR